MAHSRPRAERRSAQPPSLSRCRSIHRAQTARTGSSAPRELPEQLLSLCGIRRMSRLSRIKKSEMHLLVLFANTGLEFLHRLVEAHAFIAGAIIGWSTTVRLVCAMSSQPQIGDAIIRLVHVDMIDERGWPFSKRQKPRKMMSEISFPINFDGPIS